MVAFWKSSMARVLSRGRKAASFLDSDELMGRTWETRKDRIGIVAAEGTTDSVYNAIKASRPIFEGVR